MEERYIQISCLEVVQPIGTFYLGVMDAQDVIRISYVDIRRLDRELDNYLGIQRKLSKGRVEELERYVNTIDATFPTSVILAISSEHASFNPQTRVMRIRDDEEVAKIIDGQHRIKGLEGFKRGDFQLNVTIFVDMDIEDQAMVFATINLAQTKVNKSLVYDLYEYTQSRSPQKTSHNIARLLNSKEGSPLYRRIKVLGEATAAQGPRAQQTITQATFVESMLRFISGSSQQALDDRDLLKRNKRPARATDPEESELIFRNMFLDKKDAEITGVLWNYFGAVRQRWTTAWEDVLRPGNMLPRTNGFRAFMRVLPTLYLQVGRPGSVPSQQRFLERLLTVRLQDRDFNIDNYRPGTSGEKALADELLSALGVAE